MRAIFNASRSFDANQVKTGGELLTYVWLLLSNMGSDLARETAENGASKRTRKCLLCSSQLRTTTGEDIVWQTMLTYGVGFSPVFPSWSVLVCFIRGRFALMFTVMYVCFLVSVSMNKIGSWEPRNVYTFLFLSFLVGIHFSLQCV